jgi:hypothetical protein
VRRMRLSVPARVIDHARRISLRLPAGLPFAPAFQNAYSAARRLAPARLGRLTSTDDPDAAPRRDRPCPESTAPERRSPPPCLEDRRQRACPPATTPARSNTLPMGPEQAPSPLTN